MPTSKLPEVETGVPECLIALSVAKSDTVFCNLRPTQRRRPSTPDEKAYADWTEWGDGLLIYYPIARFLHSFLKPIRVAITYEGYTNDISTIVRDLPFIICWADESLPRLDFEKPQNWNHCPNFWGSFILAIARVDHQVTEVLPDQDGKQFFEIASKHGIPQLLPKQIVTQPDKCWSCSHRVVRVGEDYNCWYCGCSERKGRQIDRPPVIGRRN